MGKKCIAVPRLLKRPSLFKLTAKEYGRCLGSQLAFNEQSAVHGARAQGLSLSIPAERDVETLIRLRREESKDISQRLMRLMTRSNECVQSGQPDLCTDARTDGSFLNNVLRIVVCSWRTSRNYFEHWNTTGPPHATQHASCRALTGGTFPRGFISPFCFVHLGKIPQKAFSEGRPIQVGRWKLTGWMNPIEKSAKCVFTVDSCRKWQEFMQAMATAHSSDLP